MKRLLLSMAAFGTAFSTFARGVEWFTSVHDALEKAQAEDKIVLLDFTGSDWCIWCQRLKGEILDTAEFAAFAKVNLVMVEVDFPNNKPLSAEQRAANDDLAAKYNIQGYPTLILLDRWGKQVGKAGYVHGGPKPFIERLEKIPGIRHVDPNAKPQSGAATIAAPRVPAPPQYGDLALKGISGAAGDRLALINNQTLSVGETAKVKVRDARVDVTCKEIREDSVLIVVDGKVTELKLSRK